MPHKEIDGIPSVTQIIGVLNKPWLVYWYGKYGTEYCERVKKESQEVGTKVHAVIEAFLLNGKKYKPTNAQDAAVLKSFKKWASKNTFKAISIEPKEPLISKIYMYQGTYDAIGYVNNSLYVCDWKTSNRVDDTIGLQLSAYAWLFAENNGLTEEQAWNMIPHGLVLKIDKDTGKINEIRFEHLMYYFEVFKSLILPYQFITKTGGWYRLEDQK